MTQNDGAARGRPGYRVLGALRGLAEAALAAMMAAMFATFLIQIAIRYTARQPQIAEAAPLLDPALYGWTLEFCLVLWVWIIFFGNAFVVRERDHVTFDILREAVRPGVRRVFVVAGSLAVAAALAASVLPTWDKFHILRLKQTATLSGLLGDWVRMRDIYSVYILFLAAVPLRYLWLAWRAARGRAG